MASFSRTGLWLLRATGYLFAKDASASDSREIHDVWRSLPAQLARENRRFILGRAREGTRGKDLEGAIRWLLDAGLERRVARCAKPALPLRADDDAGIFKLYGVDVGLLTAASGLAVSAVLDRTALLEEFNGALAERFVAQEIVAHRGGAPHYWAPNDAQAEVDFLVETASGVLPIEVKASVNLRSKSLKSSRERYEPAEAWRASLAGYRVDGGLTNVPLWAVGAVLGALTR